MRLALLAPGVGPGAHSDPDKEVAMGPLHPSRLLGWAGCFACVLLVSLPVAAATALRIIPPDRSTFAVGQRFDLRVEATGLPAGDAHLTLALNGAPVTELGGAKLVEGSSGAGKLELTARNVSIQAPMAATLTATLQYPDGTLDATSTFRVVDTVGPAPRAKNVILMIGDGMGVAHREAARAVSRGLKAGRYNDYLEMETMQVLGMVSTSALNAFVTDSANGATAYAGGNKTDNGALCAWPDDTSDSMDNPQFETIASYLKRTRNMAIGIVTTSTVGDATPAAFLAHNYARGDTSEIVNQYPGIMPEVLMGGGRSSFGAALRAKFTDAGRVYVTTAAELQALPADAKGCLGLFSNDVMATYVDRAQALRKGSGTGLTEPSIVQMTEAALNILSKYPNGFFLMVEGALIDKQSHSNDATRAVWETIEFDRAVGVAKRFAESHGDTLVIVTADHETGAVTLNDLTGGTAPKLATSIGNVTVMPGEGMVEPPYVAQASGSKSHTGVDVPLTASGPGATQFGRVMDATEVFFGMLRAIDGGYAQGPGPSAVAGDLNGDGVKDLADVVVLLRQVVGLAGR
jgi:alkaline phosphatase